MMMITTMWTVKTTVQAATVSDGGYSGYWFHSKNGGLANGMKLVPQRLHFYNGIPAYCVEPKKMIKLGADVYNTSSLKDYEALSASTKQKISEISYFGYGYSGRKDPIHYIATQALIWETISSEYQKLEVHYLPNNPQYGHLSNANKVTDKVKTIKAAILKDVNRYEATLKAPNFQIYDENGKKVGKSGANASYNQGIVGKTYKVVDQNGILSTKKVVTNTFSNAKVKGNQVMISLTEKDLNVNREMKFLPNKSLVKIGKRPIILYGSAQNVIVRGDLPDPEGGSITMKAIGRTAKIQKLTEGKLALAGAKLALYEDVNKNGKYDVGEPKVKEFTTTEKATAIEGLVPGKKYVLHELKAAKGYVSADDISFTVKDKDVTVNMVDKAMDVVVKKVTDKGDKVADVTLTILNEDGSVATDKDGNKAIYKTKADTDWNVSKYLEEGKKYILRETEVVAGVHMAKDVMFTAPKKGDKTLSVTVTMVDKEIDVIVKKVTEKGDRVADVTLTILNEDGSVAMDKDGNKAIYKTKADTDWQAGKYLQEGKKYILRETEVVAGVYKAKDVMFTAPKAGDKTMNVTVTMVDKTMKVLVDKVDNHGKPVSGAVLQVLDEHKKVVTEFKTEGKAMDISKYLEDGKKYTLHEKEAPFGYETMKDVEFEAKGTQEQPQVIKAVDGRKKYYVAVEKVDAQNPNKKLKGAEITLFTKDGKIAKDVNGKDCVALTDEKGMVVFEVEYNEDMGGYYAKETKAPLGYRINSKHHKVVLSEDYNFAKENPVKIVVNDEALPIIKKTVHTGDSTSLTVWLVGLLIGLAGISIVIYKKKSQ